MLKFSGFADLTSCLGMEAAPAAQGRGKLPRFTTTEKAKSLFKLLAAEAPMHCMRQGQEAP